MAAISTNTSYSSWSQEELVERILELERRLRNLTDEHSSTNLNTHTVPKPKPPRQFDPSKYSTRVIALKFAYLGKRYNGLEYHPLNETPLPTVEEKIWQALKKSRLISPTPPANSEDDFMSWANCEYSKCGRTDKGVSAFGQVIGIRVRSAKPLETQADKSTWHVEHSNEASPDGNVHSEIGHDQANGALPTSAPFDDVRDEIPYVQVLNRLFPPDIRALAWCPHPPPNFSARFSCKERRYKYFFTNPVFPPSHLPANLSEDPHDGWLDIRKMQRAATKYIGLHDFRNFCKVDATKQIENFQRRIFHASIDEIKLGDKAAGFVNGVARNAGSLESGVTTQAAAPRTFALSLHGSAFLYHQVRHMMAILLLIGQGLESPDVIDELLDVEKRPRKPQYTMADETPLVLWDCVFPAEDGPSTGSKPDALEWVCPGDDKSISAESPRGNQSFGLNGLVPHLWSIWREHKMDEILAGSLLNVAALQAAGYEPSEKTTPQRDRIKVFDGGNTYSLTSKYVPLLHRATLEDVETINKKYAEKEELKRQVEKENFPP